ncbi:MAG: TauD/TfdA family dioxygenase, partial [SAR324 cluster bacterium]|nr:TauD/TfdA family dioxygenase [SAR324 cluster bacterium]
VPQAVVRTLSNSEKKTLYVGRHASHILGMPVEEGRALLAELLEWVIQPRFTYLHKWSGKDLVIWDNRCLLHRGRPWDEAKYRRVMHRTTVAGDAPAA